MIKKNPNIRFDNEEESDFSLTCTKQCAEYWACLGKGAWGGNTAQCSKPAGCECNKFFWQKDETEADAEFFKKLGGLVKKVAPIAKKGFDMYKKAKGLGILADAEAEKLNLKELIQKVKAKIQERKQKRAEKKQKKEKPAETESDAEFFKKLGGLVKKVAPIAKKGFDMYKKAKGLGILADAEAEKAAFLKKLIEKVKAKIQERKQKRAEKKQKKQEPVETESDAEFFKKLGGLVKKVAPVVKKGFDVYKKAKGLGILADAEAEKAEKAEFLKKLVEKIKTKIQERKQKRAEKKDKTGKTDKKALLKKLLQKIKSKIQERKQKKSEKPAKKEKKQKKEKKVKPVKKEKKVETEADAEFFNKLKNWWNNKGKNLFEKGVNIYNKGKELGLIKDEAEAENFDKCSACKLACSFIKDESKKQLCLNGCEAFACK
jgi:transcriptional regulator CtsR